MKPLLILMMAGSLFVQPAASFDCYVCSTQFSNSRCKGSITCKAGVNMCTTDVTDVVGLFNIISKECAPMCEPSFKDYTIVRRNISCCHTHLCNINGAGGGFTSSYANVVLALFASVAHIVLRHGL